MSQTAYVSQLCRACGRPIHGTSIWTRGRWYHTECVNITDDAATIARLTAENEALRARLETVEAETRERCAKHIEGYASSVSNLERFHGDEVNLMFNTYQANLAFSLRNLEPRHD